MYPSLFNVSPWTVLYKQAIYHFCLLALRLSIHPSISAKTMQHFPKASCHSDRRSENRQSWSYHSVQREEKEGGPENNPVYYSSALLCLQETTDHTFFLFSFVHLFNPLPAQCHLSTPAFIEELVEGKRRNEKFHLTCLLLWLENNRLFTSALAAQCSSAGRKLRLTSCSCKTQKVVSSCLYLL